MEMRLGANVICSDGRQGGKLHFVAIDPTTNTLENIVVERGFLGARDLTVAANDIAEISPDGQRIDLKIDEAELNNRPEYVVSNFVAPLATSEGYTTDSSLGTMPGGSPLSSGVVTGSNSIAGSAGGVPASIYPVGTDYFETGASVLQPQPEGLYAADDTPMIKEGARVRDRYDNTIGSIVSVSLNEQMVLTALTVKEGFLFTTQTVIPMEWVENILDTTVSLKYAKEELPNMQANPADYSDQTVAENNNRGQDSMGVADMTSNAYISPAEQATQIDPAPAMPYINTQPHQATAYANNYATSPNPSSGPTYATTTSNTGKDEVPDVVIRDVPAGSNPMANDLQTLHTMQPTAMPAYSATTSNTVEGGPFNAISSTMATSPQSMPDERSNTMSGDVNRSDQMYNADANQNALSAADNYGNTRSERGETGDSNSDMGNRSPLSPATNRIADQIAGDSTDAYSGADSRDQGDRANDGEQRVAGIPIAPATMGGASNGPGMAPPIVPINPNGPDSTNNLGE